MVAKPSQARPCRFHTVTVRVLSKDLERERERVQNGNFDWLEEATYAGIEVYWVWGWPVKGHFQLSLCSSFW
ncbi:hypothetical protein JHK82_014778 [Glycine max]|uniref:Uncharacterized protein n=2 Tax=Glycine subgen. Soja TaxID=1462606 RepID=K7KU32_SOYBN|nr:hypothetical protein JHK85_015147 [Glycine max]RZC06572.1 hypothetical protein D0Y65_014172 [Glycine soja]KAG5045389.1 hypothetical protein JHK86_014795 [Glycine max]KAG5147897.1 hypothetical protein JHK82_014778 [Glycine max]KAH1124924.1 hypothetical protein GYH30_014528 [Glycine max]